jgi:predicted SAM-dependent methyltransferase
MRVLHAGCGAGKLPPWMFAMGECDEVRLDANPAVKPHVVASITDLGDIGEFDGVYTCHVLEHLYAHDVPKALAEFYRVLKPGGRAFCIVPDLEGIHPTEDVVYTSETGLPITGLDMYFGYRPAVEVTQYMAHKTGFVSATMEKALTAAGFSQVLVKRMPGMFEVWGVAVK